MPAVLSKTEFVRRIRLAVVDTATASHIAMLSNPPGRSPSQEVVDRANWFNRLPDNEKELVTSLIQSVVFGTTHSVLCVLDGVSSIRDDDDDIDTELELRWRNSFEEVTLTSEEGPMLHDLLGI